jgi:hypothetical protein
VHPLDRFPVRPDIPEDEKDFHEIDKADEDRYIIGRNGDHLMGIPFQCEFGLSDYFIQKLSRTNM